MSSPLPFQKATTPKLATAEGRNVTWVQKLKNLAPGCLGYVGDEQLPSYVGIIRNHY